MERPGLYRAQSGRRAAKVSPAWLFVIGSAYALQGVVNTAVFPLYTQKLRASCQSSLQIQPFRPDQGIEMGLVDLLGRQVQVRRNLSEGILVVAFTRQDQTQIRGVSPLAME